VSLDLEILVPDGIAVQTRVVSLRAADASGQFGVRSGHEAFLTLLVPCMLFFREESGRERYAAADGGVLIVEKNHVSVVTREAVLAERLEDVADAAAAMLESRRQLERTARAEFAELQSSLLRELHKMEKRS
jgi:F-type H+-transporting ATPase subunit epsilon